MENKYSNSQPFKVRLVNGDNIYRVDVESAKERHAEYCRNIVDVPPGSYLSDIIGEDYMNWQPGDDIWLNTTCGSGKTTLVMIVLEYFIRLGYKVLYLTNRKQLMNQVKIIAAKKLRHAAKDMPPEFLDLIENLDNKIYFANYQGLVNAYKNSSKYKPEVFEGHKVLLVCDEAHWFTSDCLFSEGPDIVLDKLLRQFSSAITLYMTSTDWDIYSVIGRRLAEIHPERYIPSYSGYVPPQPGYSSSVDYSNSHLPYELAFNACYISKGFDNGNVKAYSFKSYDDIVERIKNTPASEKWLIYADTKEHGYELHSKIQDSVFIFSEDQNHKLTDSGKAEKAAVVTEEKFEHRVLIATSILDCGTSISDKEVKHVVINSIDPVTTMQFVGRIRRSSSPLNIYFNDRSVAEINGRLRNIDTDIDLANALVSNIGNRRSNDPDGYARMLLSSRIYDSNGELQLNRFAYAKTESLKDYLMYLVDPNRELGEKTFLKHQLELFGFSLDECHDLGVDKAQKAISDISALIDTVVDKELNESEYKDFSDKLDDLLNHEYGSTIIRKGHTHTPQIYNKRFSDKGIPYEVTCKAGDTGKIYFFRKIQGIDKDKGTDNGAA